MEFPQSAWCAFAATVNKCRPSTNTGTRIVWSAVWVLARYGSLCRYASPARNQDETPCMDSVWRPPPRTWMGKNPSADDRS